MADDAPPAEALVQELKAGLAAYVSTYDLPAAVPLESIVGSLISVSQPGPALVQDAHQVQATIQAVLQNFDALAVALGSGNFEQSALAEAAYQRRSTLEGQVRDTVNAYIQQFAPSLTAEALQETILTAIPLVHSGPITQAEVTDLVGRLAAGFNLEAILSAHLNPAVLELAKTVAVALSQKPLEAAVAETVSAYVEAFAPSLTRVGDGLIENAVGAILRNKVEFNIDTNLDLANQRLLVDQVSFKLNIMQASPPPGKTARQVAAQIHHEIERFQQQRAAALGGTQAAAGLISDDGLSISSGWTFTDADANGSNPPGGVADG